jgi:hypothetical protein
LPIIVRLLFVCPQAANVKVKSVKKQNVFMLVICLLLGRPTITANEKGLAFVGELEFRLPITEAQ